MVFRKTVTQIIAPLRKMQEQLKEAVNFHTEQAALHRAHAAIHEVEVSSAATFHYNLTKIVGGTDSKA